MVSRRDLACGSALRDASGFLALRPVVYSFHVFSCTPSRTRSRREARACNACNAGNTREGARDG